MKYQEWTFVDKTQWPIEGPWTHEPDKVQWQDEATGLPCIALRNHGNWCGYVGVTEGHPAFEQGYDEVSVEVHGGLTFANHCQPEPTEEHRKSFMAQGRSGDSNDRVCHVVEPGEPDNVWWLGFDCAHCSDLRPPTTTGLEVQFYHERRAYEAEYAKEGKPEWWTETYRTLDYVKKEVTHLAHQLKEMA